MAKAVGLFNMEVPEGTDPRAHYIARGTRGLQVNVFQLPSLITKLAQRDLGTSLSVVQHRKAYRETVRRVVMQYLRPSAQHALMIDQDTHDGDELLLVSGYATSGNADNFLVFPSKVIVEKHTVAINGMIAGGEFVASATGCPVTSGGLIGKMTDLANTAADRHFYPLYEIELQPQPVE